MAAQPERFRQAGILRVLMKPCEPESIAYALRELLGAGRSSDAGEGFAAVSIDDRE